MGQTASSSLTSPSDGDSLRAPSYPSSSFSDKVPSSSSPSSPSSSPSPHPTSPRFPRPPPNDVLASASASSSSSSSLSSPSDKFSSSFETKESNSSDTNHQHDDDNPNDNDHGTPPNPLPPSIPLPSRSSSSPSPSNSKIKSSKSKSKSPTPTSLSSSSRVPTRPVLSITSPTSLINHNEIRIEESKEEQKYSDRQLAPSPAVSSSVSSLPPPPLSRPLSSSASASSPSSRQRNSPSPSHSSPPPPSPSPMVPSHGVESSILKAGVTFGTAVRSSAFESSLNLSSPSVSASASASFSSHQIITEREKRKKRRDSIDAKERDGKSVNDNDSSFNRNEEKYNHNHHDHRNQNNIYPHNDTRRRRPRRANPPARIPHSPISAVLEVDSERLPQRDSEMTENIRVTFSTRDHGSSALFYNWKKSSPTTSVENLHSHGHEGNHQNSSVTNKNKSPLHIEDESKHIGENKENLTVHSASTSRSHHNLQINVVPSSHDQSDADIMNLSTSPLTAPSTPPPITLDRPDPALANRVYSAAATGRHPFSTLDLSVLSPEDSLPFYTNLMKMFLMSVGLVPMKFKILKQNPNLFVIFPSAMFLFLLANAFFLTIDTNVNNVTRDSGLKLVSTVFTTIAPLASWVGCFFFIGISKFRADHLFTQLANLEEYEPHLVKIITFSSLLAGIILFGTINLNVLIANVSTTTSVALANVYIYLIINYLIITFVVILLCSLLCRFHSVSFRLLRLSLESSQWTVKAAIQEHAILVKIMQQNSRYIEWILGLPLGLYCSGAFVSAFQILSSKDYSNVLNTLFTLVAAFATLLIPLYNATTITSQCDKLKDLMLDIDLTDYLMDRQSLIQQFILLPNNAFFIFGLEIRITWLTQLAYLVLAATLVIVSQVSR